MFYSRQGQEIFLYFTLSRQAAGPFSLPSNEYRRLFLREQRGQDVKLIIHIHPVLRAVIVELFLHSPTRFHGVVLN
jgi:hypothetical protein